MDNKFMKPLWLCSIYYAILQTHAMNCAHKEREALTAFKRTLSDPSARLSSWTAQNCCHWHGVTCDSISGKVTKIDLRNSIGFNSYLDYFLDDFQSLEAIEQFNNSCLGGQISPSLLQLEDLSYLDLSLNNFNGAPLPDFFGMLKNLRYLNLSSAYFGGFVPPHLGNLSNLRYLDLSAYNQLFPYGAGLNIVVENLQWLSGFSSLEYLDVQSVDLGSLRGNWMREVNSLSSLSELYLSECNIQSFDSSVGFMNLTSLRVLDLSDNLINSVLPLWLSNLTSLTKLDLDFNNFHGTIPQDFVNLKNLQYLDLSGNNLRNRGDNMPSCLRNLCELRILKLADNSFSCTIDELLGRSSNCFHISLEKLVLCRNRLVGEVSNSLGTLENLQHLDLSNNMLWGSFPASIGNLSSLQYLDVSSNLFNGTIPSSLGLLSNLNAFLGYNNSWRAVITEAHLINLTKLESLEITTNRNRALIFNVSYDWIPPFRLKILRLRNCFVGPQFPVWLQVQNQLVGHVIISNAGVGGSVPKDWICNLSSDSVTLDLSNNLLEGKLSHVLLASQDPVHNNLLEDSISSKYPILFILNLEHNLLSGSIPSNIGDLMPKLTRLYLSNNQLSGTIPPSIQKMKCLEVLSLSDNQFSGELFDSWKEFKSLSVIDLANNNLYGKIPSSIGLSRSLENLILNNNHLHGEIPKSLRNCSLLGSVDLSENRLYGTLPTWIGEAVSNFWLLNLRSNHFSGTIPRNWCNLPFLRVFDVSNNNLSGEIPSCLNNWTVMAHSDYSDLWYHSSFNSTQNYSEKTTLVMKGRELEYQTILRYVLTIDVSSNKLNGTIPNEITNLHRLGTLNLSNNDLIGIIPVNIGAMQQLQTLDLSINHLSGTIPTSLASLDFLTHLNLSFNNLTGTIPTGRQLQTLNDPSIYEGNPLLTKGGTSSPNTNFGVRVSMSEEHDGEGNDSEVMLGLYVSMAIGFPIGLNILFFTVFTNESRRVIYFRFVDRVSYNILEGFGFVIICMRRIRWRRS